MTTENLFQGIRRPLGKKMSKFQLCDAGMNMQQFPREIMIFGGTFRLLNASLYLCQRAHGGFSSKLGDIRQFQNWEK